MQIRKSFIFSAVVSLCAVFAHADTEAQAKAREELRRKMAELEAANAQPKVSQTVKPVDRDGRRDAENQLRKKIGEEAKPQPVQPVPAPKPPQSAGAAEIDASQQAREQLRQKIEELESQKAAAATPAPEPAPAPAPPAEQPLSTPPVVPAPVAKQPVAAPEPAPVSPVIYQPASAKDTEVIEKARSAVRQKIAEIEDQQPTLQAPVAAEVVAPAPAPVPAVAPAVTSQSDAVAKAREDLRRKIAELESRDATPKAPEVAPVVTTKPVVAPPVAAAVPAPARTPRVAPPVAAVPPVAPAKTPKFENVPGIPTIDTSTTAFSPAPEKREPERGREKARVDAEKWAMRTPSSFNTDEIPSPAVSPAKAEKLAELLRRYMADEVSPEQYHKERAQILAEK